MTEIVFTRRAVRDFNRLIPQVRSRILTKLRELAADPFTNARKLSDQSIGTFRYRIGNYRVIFDYLDDKIVILRVGDRKDIY